jgi:hypothetical protein
VIYENISYNLAIIFLLKHTNLFFNSNIDQFFYYNDNAPFSPANNRLSYKYMLGINALAYFVKEKKKKNIGWNFSQGSPMLKLLSTD